ncbi:MAG: hypothetical protein HY696_03125 [Deltaproteobacteria bacterium]|nr:hypothetical protein [Deltaproteobacteria bacterium]
MVRRQRVLCWVVAIAAVSAFYLLTQFATARLIGNDGHFHIQLSRSLLERGIPRQLPELAYTIWGEAYRDHHWLFHVASIPFALLPDIRVGAKLEAACFAALAALVFCWALTQLQARMRWCWVLLFCAGASDFLFRMQMARGLSLATAILLIVVVALLRQRYWLLFVAVWVNVWLYDSFLLVGLVTGLWWFSVRCTQDRWDWIGLRSIVAGFLCGSILNPYFPENFASYFFNLRRSLAPLGSIPISAEWHPANAWDMIVGSCPLVVTGLVLLVASTLVRKRNAEQSGTERVFLLLLGIAFVGLFARYRRMVDFAVPILLLGLAAYHRLVWERCSVVGRRRLSGLIAVVAVSGAGMVATRFCATNQPDEKYQCYLRAGEWLDRHLPAGALIFPTDWDDFPVLYFRAPQLRYVVGLDPYFMQRYDAALYQEYVAITRGEAAGPYAPRIVQAFRAHYVFTDTDEHQPFLRQFDREPGVYRVFNEPLCRVYTIRPDRALNQ